MISHQSYTKKKIDNLFLLVTIHSISHKLPYNPNWNIQYMWFKFYPFTPIKLLNCYLELACQFILSFHLLVSTSVSHLPCPLLPASLPPSHNPLQLSHPDAVPLHIPLFNEDICEAKMPHLSRVVFSTTGYNINLPGDLFTLFGLQSFLFLLLIISTNYMPRWFETFYHSVFIHL